MTALIEMLQIELSNLIALQSDLRKDSVRPVSASIVSREVKGSTYYLKSVKRNGKRSQTYLGDRSSSKLLQTARAAYKKRLMDLIDHNIKVIKQTLSKYRFYHKAAVIAALSPALIDVPFNTEFSTVMKRLFEWANADYDRNTREFGNKVILAKDGRRVRSKSECVIYNILLDAGIPFRYDSIITLKRIRPDGTIETFQESPDFLILCPDGSEIIIEHAGKLDSLQYAETLAKKLQLYQLNGFILGYSLFVTSDEVLGGLNSKEITAMIKTISVRFPCL